MDNYKNPRNQGTLKDALHSHEDNPLCGDEIDMYIEIKDNKIKKRNSEENLEKSYWKIEKLTSK